MFSAVMEIFDTEFIACLFNKEKTIEEARVILQYMYTNKRELLIRSLKCYFAKHKNIKDDIPKYV